MNSQKNQIIYKDLGIIDFEEAYKIQLALFEQHEQWKINRRRGYDIPPPPDFILICEHLPVITIGVSGKESNLLVSQEILQRRNIKLIKTNRGGDVTAHNPGQIVMYPILDLERYRCDVKWFLKTMEEAVISLLREYTIDAIRIEGRTGVWIRDAHPPRKICSIGIRCSRWITMHGLALNVNNDLSIFSLINPCGFTNIIMTSMEKETGAKQNIYEVKERLLDHFLRILNEARNAEVGIDNHPATR